MKKLIGMAVICALLGGITASAATVQENTVFPDQGVVLSQLDWTSQLGLQDRLITGNANDLSIGQSFSLESETTLRAITIQNHQGRTWGTGTHALELWIGSNEGSASSFVAGVTNLMTTIDLAETATKDLSFLSFNLDSDLVLPAGNYGFQLNWTTRDPSHFMYAKRIDGSSSYTNGSWLYETTDGGVLPFDDIDTPIANDLVFALHSSVIGLKAAVTATPEAIEMLVPLVDYGTGTVAVAYISDTTVDITSIVISEESNEGAFSVLSTVPQTMLYPSPSNTLFELMFDNTVAGLAPGETATGLVTIAWSETGGAGDSGELILPISAANGYAAGEANTFTGTISSEWSDAGNWELGRIPGSLGADSAVIDLKNTVNVTNDFVGLFPWETIIRGGGTLNIDADLSNGADMYVGWAGAHNYAFVNQSNGLVNATALTVGDFNGLATNSSIYSLVGGSLDVTGTVNIHTNGIVDVNGGAFSIDQGPANINVGSAGGLLKVRDGSWNTLGTAAGDVLTVYADVELSGGTVHLDGQNKFQNELKVIGDDATITIEKINTPPAGGNPSIVYEMGPMGISTIDGNPGGWATLSSYSITVDGSNYIGGSGTFTLFDCTYLTATSTAVTVSNFAEGVSAVVTQDMEADIITLTISVPGYDGWIGGYGLSGADAEGDYDYDLDGEVNLYEYAFGGDPTNMAIKGYVPAGAPVDEMDASYFEYVYARRVGDDTGLDYQPQFGTDLVYTNWSGDEVVELPGTGTIDADYEAVTNRVEITGKDEGFMQLIVDEI